MSEKLPTIWMNVTTSAYWERPPVGIVRVERSLRDELLQIYGGRFKQCIWSGSRFIEWDPGLQAVDSKAPARTSTGPVFPAVSPELPPIFPILNRRQALLALGQGFLSLLPARTRPFFNRFLYRIRPGIGRLLASEKARVFLNRLRRQRTAAAKNPQMFSPGQAEALKGGILFSPKDVLISVGLDWDHPYYKEFYELRKSMGVRVITCCYDLIPVLYPQYCVNNVSGIFTSYFLEIADGSDLILCISKQSEKDLNEMLHLTGGAKPLTHVFPLGDNVVSVTSGDISSGVRDVLAQPFILFVSTIERRKNHEILYRAYHLLCKQGLRSKLPKIVFVGMQGWGVNELIKDIELDPQTQGLIVRMNHVSDAELRALYEGALFCVFPSLYEGWGLPVGEALALGKAVISSPRGSLVEVGGDAVHYLEPWNAELWAKELLRMATDEDWRKSWENKVQTTYLARTWSDAALSVKKAIDLVSQ